MPVLLIERSLNVAMPFTALTGVVPLSVPVLGLLPIAMVTDAVLVFAKSPLASSTLTVTAGVIEAPAAVFAGCWANTNFEAA